MKESLLERIARDAMVAHGLEPDFSAPARAQIAGLREPAAGGYRDLRELPWSSIDNDESRDLDQLEVCVEDKDHTRVLIAIADVDVLVPEGSPLDEHAGRNTTSVYTPAIVFPMLPPQLSTNLTSLNPGEDRLAIVVDMAVDSGCAIQRADIYRAIVRNKAKLAYNALAAWLDDKGPAPAPLAEVPQLADQIRLQDRIAA